MKPTDSTSLPDAVARYIEAANRFDAASAAGTFTADAVVRDEQKTHRGRAAIERWIAETSQSSQPHVTVTSVQTAGATVNLTGRVAGNFPGSPVELEYAIQLQGGQIAELSIR